MTTQMKFWNLEGQVVKTLTDSSPVISVAFSPDGKTIATANDNKTVALWNFQGQVLQPLTGHVAIVNGYNVTSVAFSPDSKIATADGEGNGTVTLRNRNGRREKTLRFNLKGQKLETIVDVPPHLRELEAFAFPISSVAFSPDGKTIGTAGLDGKVKLWNLEKQVRKLLDHSSPVTTLRVHSSPVTSIAFSPDGKTIASGSDDKTVKLWNLEGKVLKTLNDHSSRVTSVTFSPDGKTIASRADDGTVKLWNLE
ncbi:MAG: WD40 repeat domain-containing protein [Coleofasciculaceae cyanobacterium SM2_1_6]|nr:WD40 repeat domain-containing protein [Coleofasciculaceae cyanobacterium SM2_1_6]